MKIKLNLIQLILTIGVIFSTNIHAQSSGTITFSGEVDSHSCTPSVNGGGTNGTVTLNTASDNIAMGTFTRRSSFSIALTGCQQTLLPARAYFYSQNISDNYPGLPSQLHGILAKSSGSGANWGYAISPTVNFSDRFQISSSPVVTAHAQDNGVNLSSGNATLWYLVGYVDLTHGTPGDPTYSLQPGNLNAQANYTIYFH